jgi:hypothetical protein
MEVPNRSDKESRSAATAPSVPWLQRRAGGAVTFFYPSAVRQDGTRSAEGSIFSPAGIPPAGIPLAGIPPAGVGRMENWRGRNQNSSFD